MSKLTKLDHVVLAAADNEAVEMPRELVEQGLHAVRAWRNAHSYADQAGISVEQFRKGLTKIYHITAVDAEEFKKETE